MNMQTDNAIVIVGGGPVGSVLALLLTKAKHKVMVLEARKQGASHGDKRALALSYGSRRILEKLGVWQSLASDVTAINTIHVSQKGSLGRALLHAKDYKQQALGYVLSYGALSAALDNALANQKMVNYLSGASAESISSDDKSASVKYMQSKKQYVLSSKLVVLADGGKSLDEIAGLTRNTKEYGHDALISKVHAELPHNNIAYERFAPSGPMALLPNGQHDFSLVWTGKKDYVSSLLALSDAEFLTAFHAAFGDRVGQFLSVEKRIVFPLKMSQINMQNIQHLAVIGNAAQTMHPVAGQGFNVGLRDAESLAQHITAVTDADLGNAAMLSAYARSREKDTKGGLKFTDFLVNIFSNEILGVSSVRSAGLGFLEVLHPVKAHLVGKMSFGK